MKTSTTKNILLVDDQQNFIELLARQLRECDKNYCIMTAGNGNEALKALESAHVDLVITDLKMPGMDGFELVSHIKNKYPAIPVMVMSFYLHPESERELSTLGVSQCIDKNLLTGSVLKNKILEVL